MSEATDSVEPIEMALTEIWESKTPSQRQSLDQGDWEQGVMDALAWRPLPEAPKWRVTVTLQSRWRREGGELPPPAEIVWLKGGSAMAALGNVLNALNYEEEASNSVEVLAVRVERVEASKEQGEDGTA